MLRRLLVTTAVVLAALLLLFVQNKVLVGDQDLTADLRAVDGSPRTFAVVLKDVAGNPVDAFSEDREAIARRLAGSERISAIAVNEVVFNDADHRVRVTLKDAADEGAVRARLAGKPFARANAPRSLFHLTRGIDLRGGVEFVCRLHNDEGVTVPADEETVAILRARLDERGLTEPAVAKLSNGDIQVVIPGGTKADAASTRRVLETTGRLEFREVLDTYYGVRLGDPDAQVLRKPGGGYAFAPRVYHNRGDVVIPKEPEPGEEPNVFYRLDRAALTGKDVKDAGPTLFQGDKAIHIEFTAIGAARNEEFTRMLKAKGDRKEGTGSLAIVFDGVVKSNAHVEEPSSASCVIHGRFTDEDIENLRSALKGGSLSVTPEVLSERVVGSTLGEETIRKGLWAMGVSFVAIVLFMFWYYRGLGLVANLCLVATTYLIWAIMSMFNATVTLPGLAGLVLTIGMAVDTNILIFERIREELKAKTGMKASIEAGYDRAFLTIIDAHLTTFLTAFILYWIGSGPVKGFGLTLMIGIVVNLFSGVYIGRMLTDWWCAKREEVSMSEFFMRSWKAPYVEWRWFGYAFSVITAVAGALYFAFGHSLHGSSFERNFDIDFTGGNMAQVIFKEELNGAKIEEIVNAAHAKDSKNSQLLDPAELRKQPYFAEFGGGKDASRQWVFRSRDEEGGALEAKRADLEAQRGKLQREADRLRAQDKPDEVKAKALDAEIKPLTAQITDLGNQIGNRTEAFKAQIAGAFAGLVPVEGDEIAAATWIDRTLTLRLKTLEPVGATAAAEVAVRLQKKGDSERVEVAPVDGGLEAKITYRARPNPRSEAANADAVTVKLAELFKAAKDAGDEPTRHGLVATAQTAYTDLVNVSAGQKITIARPYPSTEHFSGQVAAQMKWQALLAVMLSLLGILCYVAMRFEFRFGIGAVLSLFHDVVVTVGVCSLLGIRIDLTVVAAVLTIIGYSINDTIVTFDRIRELMKRNLEEVAKGLPVIPLPQIIDDGIAQTMPRTILTTGTVILTVVVLLFFGGEALHAFSACLLIGLISGTYSSIFVASPLLLSFKGTMVLPPTKPEGDGDGTVDGEV